MSPSDDDALGFSALLYLAALLGALALFVMPVYLVNGPTVIKNPSPSAVSAALAARQNDGNFPLARLKHEDIVDPAIVQALNDKDETTEPAHRPAGQRASAPRRVQPAPSYADAAPAGQHPGPFKRFYSRSSEASADGSERQGRR